ncbi:MAG TPA: thioredoxin family protein [Chthoniobacterales bacterium]|nr:thioredoxin family protein [Chthoniobacterales bacterium]
MSTQTMTLEKTDSLTGHEVVSRSEWLIARKDLLEREKELTRLRDQVAAERRALPWVKIEKEYTFDGPEGEVTLAELFDGRSQLFIKHFMMAPGQQTQCVGCSLEVDHTEGILTHLENHDVIYVAVARAPIEEIEAVRKRMGWKFRWVSSYRSDFNYDFNVSFTHEDAASGHAIYNFGVLPEWAAGIEDLSGDSVFYKDEAGDIFHTYSTFGRGGEEFLGIYRFLDATPKGREENGPYHSLTDWARPRNMYGKGGTVEPTGRYHQPACACEAHQSAA